MTSVTLPADEASRVLWNATLFSTNEKGTIKDEVLVEYKTDFQAVGADAYSAGTDHASAKAELGEFAEWGICTFLSIKTAKALERSIRARGSAEIDLAFTDDGIEYDGLTYEAKATGSSSGWGMILELLDSPTEPEGFGNYLEVDAKRLAQFGSVKTKGDYPLSLYVQSERVWQVKIGPTFRGLICPLSRETLVEKYAEQASAVMWGVKQ